MNKISVGTITRTIALIIALTNNTLSIFGKSPLPIDDDMVESLVSSVITVVVAGITFWKNNSFTQKAIAADKTFK